MRKFFYALVFGLVTVMVIPSCSTSDELSEMVQESDLDVSASTVDAEDKIAKPGSK